MRLFKLTTLLLLSLTILAIPLSASADSKTSTVIITFVESDDPEVNAEIGRLQQEHEDNKVREIQTTFINAPTKYSKQTKYITNNGSKLVHTGENK